MLRPYIPESWLWQWTKSSLYGGGKNTFAIKLVPFVPILVQNVLFQSHSRPILEHICSNLFQE